MNFIPSVSKCCFCIKLKTGTLFLAWVGTIGSFTSLIACILAVTIGVDVIVNFLREIDFKNTTLASAELISSSNEEEKAHMLHLLVTVVLLSLLAFSLWEFVVDFLLLIGAHNRKAVLVGQWLISALIWIFIGILQIIYQVWLYTKLSVPTDKTLVMFAAFIIVLGSST